MMRNLLTINEVRLSYKPKLKPFIPTKIGCSEDIYKLMKSFYDINTIEHKESFKVALLNQCNVVLGIYNVSEGGITGTVVDTRHILQAAILANATSIILCHNHPSTNLDFSTADRVITNRVKKSCELMDIRLLDHLIINKETYYSFSDEGLI